MNTLRALPIALVLLAANPAFGQDFLGPIQDFVDTLTERPAQRPVTPRPVPPVVEAVTPPPVPRPRPPELPDAPQVQAPDTDEPEEAPAEEEEEAATEAEVSAPRSDATPEPAPDRTYQAACPAVLMGLVEGEMLPPLSEGACGEQSPLLVTGIMSRGRMVTLSTPMTTNCQMASALPRWLETVDGYAEAMLGSPVAEIETSTSYMCRNRNNAEGGFLSEHGFANAVDVSGFTLEDGRAVDVEADWSRAAEAEGRLLRLAHDAACAGFMTVLGPEANDEHADHLHLDMGCHGASCTARICE